MVLNELFVQLKLSKVLEDACGTAPRGGDVVVLSPLHAARTKEPTSVMSATGVRRMTASR
jgi:hypothetical protein